MTWEVRRGDCVQEMAAMPAGSVDAVVCDPPYNLSFMSKAWDRIDGEPVDPAFLHWFAGFVDGEGCFSVHRKTSTGYETFDCQFSITLRADDRPILERIQRTLGMGTLSKPTAHKTGSDNPKARYSISRKADCLRLRELFHGFPLRAKKAKDLELWSDALDAWVEHEPGGGWDDVAEARNLLMASRAYVEEGVRVDPFQMWCWRWGREAMRVLKPGGHCLAFGGTRTHHRLAAGLEDAGFEIRDMLAWIFGSGFPKSLDVSKAIDRAAGAEREVVGHEDRRGAFDGVERESEGHSNEYGSITNKGLVGITAPATPEAERWQGWGTALKPAHEPVVVARKPLSGTVSATVLEHGCGALNVDGCRVGTDSVGWGGKAAGGDTWNEENCGLTQDGEPRPVEGRWPPNVLLSHSSGCVRVGTRKVRSHNPDNKTLDAECEPACPVRLLDEQTGPLPGGTPRTDEHGATGTGATFVSGHGHEGFGDQGGGPSRFFPTFEDTRFRYVAKAGRAERNAGLDGFEERPAETGSGNDRGARRVPGGWEYDREPHPRRNGHPTVKPIELMRWLVRLVTPPGGTVCDPFTGSGSTGCAAVLEGFGFIGIERESEYADIAEARIGWWFKHRGDGLAAAVLAAGEARDAVEATGQLELDW